MIAAILAATALGAGQDLPPPVAMVPAPPTTGQCLPDLNNETPPETVAAQFYEAGTREYPEHRQAAMAALLTADAMLFNGHDNVTLTSEDFLSLVGMGQPGRLETTETMVSGGTVVLRSPVGRHREMLTVIRTDGGCIATVATFYD